jgi:hypothetical protein
MTSTELNTLIARCLAGVLDATMRTVSTAQIDDTLLALHLPLCSDSSASCSGGRSSVECISGVRRKGSARVPTNNRRHYALINPCTQSGAGPPRTLLDRVGARARRSGVYLLRSRLSLLGALSKRMMHHIAPTDLLPPFTRLSPTFCVARRLDQDCLRH